MSDSNKAEQIITYKPYMVSLLRRLKTERVLVSIRIDSDPVIYNSIIVDTNYDTNEFFLDELSSIHDHKKMKKGTRIHFDGRLSGVRVQFETTVTAIDNDNGIAMYRLALPERMLYKQRRRHFRASVRADQGLAITLPLPLKEHIIGDIVDLSASGFCSRLTLSDSANLSEKQAIYDATINLPGRNNITCDIQVRSVRKFPNKGYALVGSEFIEMPPNHQTHLERIVAMLDRNQRRIT